jgi:hypothetical protein
MTMDAVSEPTSRSQQLAARLLGIGVVGMGVAAFVLVSRAMDVPHLPLLTGSLFQEPSPLAAFLIVAMCTAGVFVAGTLVARNFSTGILAAAAGLIGLSMRFGTAHDAIAAGSSAKVFLTLSMETTLLMAIVVACALLPLNRLLPDEPATRDTRSETALAVSCCTLLTLALSLLLLRSELKLQSLGAIGLSAYVAASITRQLVPLRSPRALLAVPLLVGIAGYVLTYFVGADTWMIGQPRGFFAPLARALPIDFAGAGVAGIVLGSRRVEPAQDNS